MAITGAPRYDEFVFTTGDELWDRIHQAHRRFAALLSVTPSRTPIPGSDWTAGEVAGHLLTVLRRYTRGNPNGLSPDAAGVAGLNAIELDELDLVSVAEILDRVWQELADLEQLLPRTIDLHTRLKFHGGVEIDAAAALGNLIGEFLVHGRDVALARRKTWQIGSRNAALVLNVVMQVGPAYVAPGAGDLKLGIRTPESNPWILDLVDGQLTSRAATHREPVDLLLYSRAQPLLLTMYGRIGIPKAALLGTTVLGGRRPWRITRLPGAFVSP